MTNYNADSLFYNTPLYGKFLDILEYRQISAHPQDEQMIINETYQFRPDLLAYDLYENQNLWWVFAARNPNTIKDSIWDMKKGVRIFLPRQDRLLSDLGL